MSRTRYLSTTTPNNVRDNIRSIRKVRYMSEVTTHAVTQQHLEAVHEGMRTTAQMWVSGLITDREIADHFAKLSFNFQKLQDLDLLKDLLDPATGLRY